MRSRAILSASTILSPQRRSRGRERRLRRDRRSAPPSPATKADRAGIRRAGLWNFSRELLNVKARDAGVVFTPPMSPLAQHHNTLAGIEADIADAERFLADGLAAVIVRLKKVKTRPKPRGACATSASRWTGTSP